MPNYRRLADYVKSCQHVITNAEEIHSKTVDGYEDGLVSVWNVLDIKEQEGEYNYELMNELEDNIRTLAKAQLLRELMHQIHLDERDTDHEEVTSDDRLVRALLAHKTGECSKCPFRERLGDVNNSNAYSRVNSCIAQLIDSVIATLVDKNRAIEALNKLAH